MVLWESTSIQTFYFYSSVCHKVNGTKHNSQIKSIQKIIKEKKPPPEETWQSIEDQGEQEPH